MTERFSLLPGGKFIIPPPSISSAQPITGRPRLIVIRPPPTQPTISITRQPTVPITSQLSTDSKEYQRARRKVQRLPIELTGARTGDYLLGVQKAVKDVLLKNVGQSIPPFRKPLERIKQFPDLWQQFLTKLNAIDFFSQMSATEKETWLFSQANNQDTYLHEIPGTQVQVLSIGSKQARKTADNKFYEKLTAEQINLLLADPEQVWTTQQIMDLFPRKPGSKARRQVLIFNRYFWKIYLAYQEETSFTGLVLNLNMGTLQTGLRATPEQKLIVLNDIQEQTVGFLVDKVPPYSQTDIFQLILEFYPQLTFHDINQISQATQYFSPAGYKSLLQKIIRFRPSQVSFNDQIHEAGFSLLVTFSLLLLSPGSFVPDIQRYVSGLESATKRLAVSILEDGYLEPNEWPSLVSLLSASLLRQRVKSWKPSLTLIRQWFTVALKAWQETNYFVYNISGGPQYPAIKLQAQLAPLFLTSTLLDEIKSFKSDLIMTRQIAHNQGQAQASTITNYPQVMPLEQAVDHHWLPAIAYYYPIDILLTRLTTGSQAFAPLFQQLFGRVTGVNSRKRTLVEDDFFQATRQAQQLTLLALSTEPQTLSLKPNLVRSFTFGLNESWLAGLVGPLEISGTPLALVTLDPNNLQRLLAIRRPSRGLKESQLTEPRKEEAINLARQILRQGLDLNKSLAPIDLLEGARLRLNLDNSYTILTSSGNYTVEQLKNLSTNLSLIVDLDPFDGQHLIKAISYQADGLSAQADQQLVQLISSTPINFIKRALIYISNFRSSLEMNPLSRDGGGTQQSVSLEDIGAFNFLSQLSLIYPLALRKTAHRLTEFTVPFGPLLWSLREKIAAIVLQSSQIDSLPWGPIGDTINRVAEDYQTSILNEMIDRHETAKRGQFIWLKRGLGKTFIVLSYLKYLKDRNELPVHIIYTLPESAIKTIIQEVRFFNFPVELLWPIQKAIPADLADVAKRGCQPSPYHISLVEHDKFKLEQCMQILSGLAPDSIFIIDEVHKTLNDTLRTSMALQLSHLAQDFIAFTGTPVIDDKIYKLINWLEQIVSFEVNTRNFFVAVNSMIARRVETGIQIIREEVVAQFTLAEEAGYRRLVSPGLGGTNLAGTEVMAALDLSYQAASREMLKQIITIWQSGSGVMVVARNNQHQAQLYSGLVANGLPSNQIFEIKTGQSISLTDELVQSGQVPDYRVVITTMRHVLGYTLTRFNKMVTSVYPSNNADREQLEGRLDRLGQRSPSVTFITVHVGILTNILRNHENVRNLSEILRNLANE